MSLEGIKIISLTKDLKIIKKIQPNEIYNLELTLLDEEGNPYLMPPNYNAFFELSVLY
jgi:hypothetical protein